MRAVPTAPLRSPHTGQKPLGGGAGCPLEVPRPRLGRLDDLPGNAGLTLALAVRVV